MRVITRRQQIVRPLVTVHLVKALQSGALGRKEARFVFDPSKGVEETLSGRRFPRLILSDLKKSIRSGRSFRIVSDSLHCS
jgi:hypothetical protein